MNDNTKQTIDRIVTTAIVLVTASLFCSVIVFTHRNLNALEKSDGTTDTTQQQITVCAEVTTECTEIAETTDVPETEELTTEVEQTTIPEELPVYWREIPLDAEVQDFIVRESEKMKISPSIVFAIIWRESRYQSDVIGDSGAAIGLMQIHPRWHGDRIKRLNAVNLHNPIHNVAVGMDYLAELLDEGKGIEWAVMAYNAGTTGANQLVNRGIKSEYASSVLAEASRIEREIMKTAHGAATP